MKQDDLVTQIAKRLRRFKLKDCVTPFEDLPDQAKSVYLEEAQIIVSLTTRKV